MEKIMGKNKLNSKHISVRGVLFSFAKIEFCVSIILGIISPDKCITLFNTKSIICKIFYNESTNN
jgi:hypothetical protein